MVRKVIWKDLLTSEGCCAMEPTTNDNATDNQARTHIEHRKVCMVWQCAYVHRQREKFPLFPYQVRVRRCR